MDPYNIIVENTSKLIYKVNVLIVTTDCNDYTLELTRNSSIQIEALNLADKYEYCPIMGGYLIINNHDELKQFFNKAGRIKRVHLLNLNTDEETFLYNEQKRNNNDEYQNNKRRKINENSFGKKSKSRDPNKSRELEYLLKLK
jgi:hypothetical protein